MVSIEDPFDQDDWDGYRPFTAAVGDKARDGYGASGPQGEPWEAYFPFGVTLWWTNIAMENHHF